MYYFFTVSTSILFSALLFHNSILLSKHYIHTDYKKQKIKIRALQKANTPNYIKEITSNYLENLVYNENFKIQDLLQTNPTFSSKYSLYLDFLKPSSIQHVHGGSEQILELSFLGKYSFYHILPISWNTKDYFKAKYTNPKGNIFYEYNTSTNAFLSNKLPVKYSGLIIDIRNLKDFQFSILPKIISEDNFTIYDSSYVTKRQAIKKGIFFYIKKLSEVPFYLNAFKTTAFYARGNTYKTNIVLQNEDIQQLLSHPHTLQAFKKGNVALLIP